MVAVLSAPLPKVLRNFSRSADNLSHVTYNGSVYVTPTGRLTDGRTERPIDLSRAASGAQWSSDIPVRRWFAIDVDPVLGRLPFHRRRDRKALK